MELNVVLADRKVPLLTSGSGFDSPNRLALALDDQHVLHLVVRLLRIPGATLEGTLVDDPASLQVDPVGSAFLAAWNHLNTL